MDVCCAHVRELLRGKVAVSDLIMTGGLLRYTSKSIKEAAAVDAGGGGGGAPDDATGPAAKLAVKIVGRDPGRVFAAGERVPFVFLAGVGAWRNQAKWS